MTLKKWHVTPVVLCAAVGAGCAMDVDDPTSGEGENIGTVRSAELVDCPVDASSVVSDKELIISHTTSSLTDTVVDDVCRTSWNSTDPSCTTLTKNKWHFWYLMQQMAGTTNVSRFILRMLESVESWPTPVNGMLLQPRTLIRTKVIDQWMKQTNKANNNTNCVLGKSIDDPANINCQLAPAWTPFRLLAIVNRVDLRTSGEVSGYGGGSAGEGRFVFGFVNITSTTLANVNAAPKWTNATIILEYKLPTPVGWNPQQWAAKWHALGNFTSFDESYKVELQKLTDKWTPQFAVSGPNKGTAINQVRMNDFDFDQGRDDPSTPAIETGFKQWSLREFKLGCLPSQSCGNDDKFLVPSAVAQTPASGSNNTPQFAYNGTQALLDFLIQNEAALLDGTHVVPDLFATQPFRGAEALSKSFGSPIVWKPLNWDPETTVLEEMRRRRLFAFSACNGCHYNETETANMHIAPRNYKVSAGLSGFLMGPIAPTSDPANDPNDVEIPIEYDEPARRACELVWLVGGNDTPVSTTTGRPH